MARQIEKKLPGRTTMEVVLTFREGHAAKLDEVAAAAEARGYRLMRDSLTITFADGQPVWRFAAVAIDRSRALSPALLAEELATSEGVAKFSIVPVRN